MEVYWYISDAKIDVLRQTLPRSWTQDLVVKLKFKAPWIEAEVGHRDIKSAVSNANLIEETLMRDIPITSFAQLKDGDAPTFIRFRGRAARMIADNGYWIALHDDDTALLLGGAAKHAIGGSSPPTGDISPSIDPFGAASALGQDGQSTAVSGNLSYAWQEVFRTGGGTDGITPVVEGIALFAGRFAATRSQMRRVGQASITHVVVASPIFVRQVPG